MRTSQKWLSQVEMALNDMITIGLIGLIGLMIGAYCPRLPLAGGTSSVSTQVGHKLSGPTWSRPTAWGPVRGGGCGALAEGRSSRASCASCVTSTGRSTRRCSRQRWNASWRAGRWGRRSSRWPRRAGRIAVAGGFLIVFFPVPHFLSYVSHHTNVQCILSEWPK